MPTMDELDEMARTPFQTFMMSSEKPGFMGTTGSSPGPQSAYQQMKLDSVVDMLATRKDITVGEQEFLLSIASFWDLPVKDVERIIALGRKYLVN